MLDTLDAQCDSRNLSRDNANAAPPPPRDETPRKLSGGAIVAAELFRKGASIDEVMQNLKRARSTTCEYLSDYIRVAQPASIARWVPDEVYHQVAAAADRVGASALKPIFVELNEAVPYDVIRLVVTHLVATEKN